MLGSSVAFDLLDTVLMMSVCDVFFSKLHTAQDSNLSPARTPHSFP